MKILGFKAFGENMSSNFGYVFKENNSYKINNNQPIKFGSGSAGNGFHFCTNMEDTLRYVDAMTKKINIASVIGSGEMVRYDDEYYGYYDMYAAREIYIKEVYDKEQIIDYFYNLNNSYRVERFITGYKLNPSEIAIFKEKYRTDCKIIKALNYYQEGNKDAYSQQKVFKI